LRDEGKKEIDEDGKSRGIREGVKMSVKCQTCAWFKGGKSCTVTGQRVKRNGGCEEWEESVGARIHLLEVSEQGSNYEEMGA
jgi:hypothetical protein